ncbi:CFI-box-CTERM domain-containing protein [Nannocystis pusilla]|uniref:CFI-box-CTERM domain-containing protein n=1 Tax=Nannocystis pusilla TaxID=889268 RepID=UPI003B7D9856
MQPAEAAGPDRRPRARRHVVRPRAAQLPHAGAGPRLRADEDPRLSHHRRQPAHRRAARRGLPQDLQRRRARGRRGPRDARDRRAVGRLHLPVRGRVRGQVHEPQPDRRRRDHHPGAGVPDRRQLCFVATAAWGAPWAAQVAALRSFRDAYLKTTATGVDLVRFYYAYSPPLARVIQHEPLLRGLARVVLQPVADAASLATRASHGG